MMKFLILLKKHGAFIFSAFSYLAAMAMACVIHFSLSYFYHLSTGAKILVWAVTFVIIRLTMHFANQAFILPYASSFVKRPNVIFLAIMVLVLTAAAALNSPDYWALPVEHDLKICFDSQEPGESLKIQKLIDPNTRRLFSSGTFGISSYPLVIKSGSCVQGKILMLYTSFMQSFLAPRLSLEVESDPPGGRLYMEVNEVAAVVNFDGAYSAPEGGLILNEGFDAGRPILMPWWQRWFYGIKLIALFLSAVYWSLLFFGVVERIRTYKSI